MASPKGKKRMSEGEERCHPLREAVERNRQRAIDRGWSAFRLVLEGRSLPQLGWKDPVDAFEDLTEEDPWYRRFDPKVDLSWRTVLASLPFGDDAVVGWLDYREVRVRDSFVCNYRKLIESLPSGLEREVLISQDGAPTIILNQAGNLMVEFLVTQAADVELYGVSIFSREIGQGWISVKTRSDWPGGA